MQGTQSSIVPDMTERRSLASRQRANEVVLAAMDAEEAELGRPAWLQHWAGEEQWPVASAGGAIAPAEIRRDEAGALKTAPGTVNGYSGQSIEAAFAYETVFHFETELEAESTEDWLDLSTALKSEEDDEEDVEACLRLSGEVIETPPATGAYPREANPHDLVAAENATILNIDDELAGRTDEILTVGGLRESSASIDPKAVRAAIFRLAQGGSSRWQPGDRQVAGTQEVVPAALHTAGAATVGEELAGILPSGVQADFAEVAQQVWLTKTTASNGQADQDGERTQTAEPERSAQLDAATVASFLTEAELRESESLPAFGPEIVTSEREGSGPAFAVRDVHAAAAQEQIPSLPAQPTGRSIAEEGATAGGAPALAHDAGNLLSALKLYSELLALSGVLQARHSHYAEDLKLLAARSEVLIQRLLQSFTLAEHEIHIPKAQELLSETAERGTRIEGQAAQDQAHVSQSLASDSLAPITEPPESGCSNPEGGGTASQTVRYSTDERLSATHVSNRDGLKEDPEGSVDPDLTIKTIPSSMEVAASPYPDVVGPQNRPASGGTIQLDEIAETPTESAIQHGDSINLVELLTRWGGLLSMIARGPVQVNFGPNASLPVPVDEEALERILVNLVHNAMEATRDGGSVRIGVGRLETRRPTLVDAASIEFRPASRMILTVDDSGCGMTEQQVARALGTEANAALNQVSDRVKPASNASAPRQRGHGMGLQIVRELVASSGGELAIYSRRGAGTRIEIQWPVLAKTLEEEGLPQRIPPASTANISPHSRSQGSIKGLGTNLSHGNLEGAIAC